MTARIAATVALFTIGSCFAKSYHAERSRRFHPPRSSGQRQCG